MQKLNQAKEEFKLQVNKEITQYSTTRIRQCLEVKVKDAQNEEAKFKGGCWKYKLGSHIP